MISLESIPGMFSWTCVGEFGVASFCIQRTIIDIVNLLFVCVFYVTLLINSLRQTHNRGSEGRGWLLTIASICCGLVSIAYFINGLWNLVGKSKNSESNPWGWIVYILRGLVWMSSTISLLVQRSKWIKVLNFVWWVLSCLLVSALNIEILIIVHTIQSFYLLEWLVNFVLLFCAIRNLSYLVSQQRQDSSLSEPLVAQKNGKNERGKGKFTFFNRLTFSWINPLLRLGYSKPLAPEDVPSVESEDEANVAYEKFQQTWSSLLRGKTSNSDKYLVLWTIAKVYLNDNIYIAICALLRTTAVVVSPLILYAFVNYMNHDQEDPHEGLYILGCLIVCKAVESLSQRQWFFHARRSGMRMRSALMVAVYQKQLKLSSLGRRSHSTGEIVNYIAVDAYRMGEFPWWFHTSWSCGVQLLLGVVVLFKVVGVGALFGLIPLLTCGLLNVPFAKMLQRCQMGLMVAQDERLRTTSEILNNMKVIKLQSWEDRFKNLVETFRDREFNWLSEAQFKKAYGTLMYWMSPTIVSSVVFLGCALFNSSSLNAATIFTILATLRVMSEPVRTIPEGLSVLIQMKVSFDRLNRFLLDDEITADELGSLKQNADSSIIIREGQFNWNENSETPTLRDFNLEIKLGQKIAVCGPVGAGKSSFLHAILGVIPKLSGTVRAWGSIAYVSQTAWIQSGTVRDNILFGKPMDETRYVHAIKACALDKDISSFSHGDLTEIGQRGLNLSGGQKQRLQLARAVYNDADIYLLDDPFSAVDAHTASALFKDCVMVALANKTVVLVTHQVEFLSDVDKIIVMEDGKITQSGSFEDLLMVGTPFEILVNAHKDAITVSDANNKGQGKPDKVTNPFPEKPEGSSLIKQDSEADISSKGPAGVQLTQEEEMEIGDVGWKPFWDYLFFSKGAFLLCICLLYQIGFVTFQAAATYWLALAIQIPNITNALLIGTYTAISCLSAIFVFFRSLTVAHLGLKGSKNFFTAFNNAIFKAPMLFFDSTPVGRILTRASSDLSILDNDISFSISFVIAPATEILAIIVIMASVTWQVLLVAIPAMVATKFIQDYYHVSARELIRINGTTKAPIVNYASETSLGVVTIRAFDMADRFFRNYLKLVDTDARLFFYSNGTIEWLILRIEILQNLTLFAGAFLIICLPKGFISPGLAGLSLSYALSLTMTQIFLCRWYSNLSNYIISVERIKQFIHIPPEPPAVVEENRPLSSWPSKGRIELQALKIRYRENAPLVLKGISCTFKEGHRVGVVGRTGSGKTTLISALFRLVEPASGQILIDGVNICAIGLKDLRMKLSIIPQEPTLFRGSVRTNLDPLGLYSDEEIWKALGKCQLKATISSLPNLLDSFVSDEGENWSAGQRQLFCLGRVLLKRNKILVLDEATASIDSATDAILQRIIRKEFSDCTVITVAHRVPTVIDSDVVMVLSYGKLLEYDEPSKLMGTDSSFSKLVAEYWSSCGKN